MINLPKEDAMARTLFETMDRLMDTLHAQIRFSEELRLRADADRERSQRLIRSMDAARDRLRAINI